MQLTSTECDKWIKLVAVTSHSLFLLSQTTKCYSVNAVLYVALPRCSAVCRNVPLRFRLATGTGCTKDLEDFSPLAAHF